MMSNTGTYKIVEGRCIKVSDSPPSLSSRTDVFFNGPGFVEHLADAKNPQGVYVESRSHKAAVMKAQGVRESGDRIRGAR